MKPRRPLGTVLPSLFEAPPATPQWEALPAEIRQAVMPLLVRLLREHSLLGNNAHEAQEVGDER
jgi:hypothetical protein